jgi:hypothetical protein
MAIEYTAKINSNTDAPLLKDIFTSTKLQALTKILRESNDNLALCWIDLSQPRANCSEDISVSYRDSEMYIAFRSGTRQQRVTLLAAITAKLCKLSSSEIHFEEI